MSFLNRLTRPQQQQNVPGQQPFVNAQRKQRSPTTPSPATFSHAHPPVDKPLYLCQPFVKSALVKGSFKTITALPKYVDLNEWVAVNIVDFFHNTNLILSVVTESCNRETCPTMSAGPGMDYTWSSNPGRKQIKVPATEYIDYVLTWAEKLIGDETMFPTKAGREFSPNFPSVAKQLYTQFLRIFAHIYHAHFVQVLHFSLEAHLNSLFAHFLVFGLTFDLLDPKECRAPREGWSFVVGDLLDSWRNLGIIEAGVENRV